MLPGNLLHPLKLDVVGFKEEDHDYHFRVELPEPSCCQSCGATPESGAVMNVDHIKPRKIYPELALTESNLQVLCHECNHGKGNWDMTDFRPRGVVAT